MNIRQVLPILRRWLWLIVLISVGSTLLLATRLKPGYDASVKLQLTAPPQADVALFERTEPFRNLRDELTIARNDFVEVARSPEVRARTIQLLGLDAADAAYTLDIRPVRDSNFIDLNVEAARPELGDQIANAHARAAIQYSAELRAAPAKATREFLADQLRAARERAGAGGDEDTVRQARDQVDFLQKKLNEAELKENSSYTASYIQVVEPATPPTGPATRKLQSQLALALVGSLVAGALLAVLLEFATGRLAGVRTAARPRRPQITTPS